MNVTQVPGVVEYIYIVHLKLEIRNNTLTRVLQYNVANNQFTDSTL